MKYNKICMKALSMAFLVTLLFTVTACHDNDSEGGEPRITSVTNTDPDNQIEYTKAGPGTLLAVRGENLGGALKVYINDQDVWFNPTMNTNHSLLVQVPTEENGFELTAFNSNLKDEIRVVTSHGTATYYFKITAPYPSITRVAALYPRSAGDEVNVFGKNLVDIEKAYITDLTTEEIYASEAKEVGGNKIEVQNLKDVVQNHYLDGGTKTYVTASQIAFNIPELPYSSGTLVLECATGNAYFPFSTVLPAPTITGINTDMPVFGETLKIYGTDFLQIEEVKLGDKVLSEADYTVAETEDEIDIVFKAEVKPSVGSEPKIFVTTTSGTATYTFYDYSGLLADFDGLPENSADNGWGPSCSYITADGSGIPATSDGQYARINYADGGKNWWGMMCYWRAGWSVSEYTLPDYSIIPADASLDNVYLAMEVYNNGTEYDRKSVDEQGLFIHYQLQTKDDAETLFTFGEYNGSGNWGNWKSDVDGNGYYEPVLQSYEGLQPQGEWYRHVFKLSNFIGLQGLTYADLKAKGINQFRLMSLNFTGNAFDVDVCLDNVRIIYIEP